jgi:hypothetical protein
MKNKQIKIYVNVFLGGGMLVLLYRNVLGQRTKWYVLCSATPRHLVCPIIEARKKVRAFGHGISVGRPAIRPRGSYGAACERSRIHEGWLGAAICNSIIETIVSSVMSLEVPAGGNAATGAFVCV